MNPAPPVINIFLLPIIVYNINQLFIQILKTGAIDFLHYLYQVFTIIISDHWLRQPDDTVSGNPAFAVGYSFQTANLQALPFSRTST